MKKIKILSAAGCLLVAGVCSYAKVHPPVFLIFGMSLIVVWGLCYDNLVLQSKS